MRFLKSSIMAAALLPFTWFNNAHAVLVDTELSLVIDISSSIDAGEFVLQRDGYANAFRDASVQAAISALTNGIAVAAFPFALTGAQATPWFHLQNAADAEAFATAIDAIPDEDVVGTNIASGVDVALASMLSNDFEGTKLVIDVSTDGVQNVFRPGLPCPISDPPTALEVEACLAAFDAAIHGARDDAAAAGAFINALAIFDPASAAEYLAELEALLGGLPPGFPTTLEEYLTENLITGPDAFVLSTQFDDSFTDFVVSKILAEIEPEEPPTPTPTPEPSTLLILLTAMAGLLLRNPKKLSA